jgi:cytoskeletal protein RodZ
MEPEETTFEIFLRDRIKEKGISLKKLSDLSGIASNHIENLLRGDFEHVPPTPYFRGYLMRLGEVLDFDGEAWWLKIKKGGDIGRSGPADALPNNRFAKESPAKIVAISTVVLALLFIFAFSLPHIIGKPIITITSPTSTDGNPSVTTSNSIVIQGTVKNADSLYINGDEVTISSDGSWQKNVLMPQNGINPFEISAKKFLGGTTNIMEQVIYNALSTSSNSMSQITSPTSTSSSTTTAPTTTAPVKK